MVGRAVLVPVRHGGGAWCGGVWRGVSSLRLWCLPGWGCCCDAACPPPPVWACCVCACVLDSMVGCAVLVCSGFCSWCFSWLVARLVLLVHCCLCRRSAGVGGDWLSVVLFYPGRTGRHPKRVWCVIPCICFAGVVALPLVFTCSPSTFLCLRGCWPCAGVRCRLYLRPPPRTPPHLTPQLVVFCPSLCFLVSPHPPAVAPPPPGGLRFAAVGVLLRVFPCPLCALWLLCAAWPSVGASCCPPPSPDLCCAGVPPAARFPLFSLCLLVVLRRLTVCPHPTHPVCVSWVS